MIISSYHIIVNSVGRIYSHSIRQSKLPFSKSLLLLAEPIDFFSFSNRLILMVISARPDIIDELLLQIRFIFIEILDYFSK